MKRLFFILITISLYFNCVAADKDQAYQNYLQRCAQVSEYVENFEYLPKVLTKIINEYNSCISYDQWQKNGQELIEAAKQRNLEKVKQLVEEADFNAQDCEGYTALMWATLLGDKEIAELLINAKVDVNAKSNGNYFTALILATKTGRTEIVELLINAKADVNAKDNYGHTALIYAVDYANCGHKEIVKLLINANADVNSKNNDGMTAVMEAEKHGCGEIIQLLKKAESEHQKVSTGCLIS